MINHSWAVPYKWEGLRRSLALKLSEDEGNTPIPRLKWSNMIAASQVVQDACVTSNNFTSYKVPAFHFCYFSLQTGFQELLTPNQTHLSFILSSWILCVHLWHITQSSVSQAGKIKVSWLILSIQGKVQLFLCHFNWCLSKMPEELPRQLMLHYPYC